MNVAGKVVGRKKPFDSYPLPLLEPYTDLRGLLEGVIKHEVEGFNTHQQAQQTLRLLTEADLSTLEQTGKATSGLREFKQFVEVERALEVALQAFEDGLYFVFIDDAQIEKLEQTLELREDSQILFLRLTALVGG